MGKRNSNSGQDDERLGNGNGAPMGGLDPVIPLEAQGLSDNDDGPAEEWDDRVIGDQQYARDDNDPRLLGERSHDERDYTDAERLELFKLSLFQNQLPTLPEIPGYHLCWLTTANPRDSIQGRIRLGYSLVRAEELPGWEHSTLTGGQYQGYVGVNEMVAAKLPLHLYEMYMTEAHHNAPLAEEGKLTAALDAIREQAAGQRAPITLENGTQMLGKRRAAPRFEGIPGKEPRRPYQG